MTRLERNVNITAVLVPFLGVILAAVLLWNRFLGPRDVAIFVVMYVLTAMGVTVVSGAEEITAAIGAVTTGALGGEDGGPRRLSMQRPE